MTAFIGPPVRDAATVIGKDSEDNYWVTLFFADKVVGAVERCIRDMELARQRDKQ
jgi:hypothetical protein